MEFLTVKETAQLLRVSPITVRRYIASGQLAAERVGRGIRVRREAIKEFVTPVEPGANSQDEFCWPRKPANYEEEDLVEICSRSSPTGVMWVLIDRLDEYEASRAFTGDDPLWDIIGIGDSRDSNDVASNKYKYVAEAIAASWSDDVDETIVGAEDAGEGELPTILEALGISVGIGRSGEPTNIAEHKDEYLADAFEAKG